MQIELGFFKDERGRRRSREEKTKRAGEQKSFAVHGRKQRENAATVNVVAAVYDRRIISILSRTARGDKVARK